MYTKQEAALLVHQFWTAFGKYMAPVASAEGAHINWVNYKTGEKDLRIVLEATQGKAAIALRCEHKDVAKQQWYFNQLLLLKNALHTATGEEWDWRPFYADEHGRMISEVSLAISGVKVLNQNDWPAIISFLKPRLVALDIFWCEFKYAFQDCPL